MRRGLIWIAMVWIISCKEREVILPDQGYDYFPLTKGFYQIYDVDSTYFKQNIKFPVLFQIKMVITDSIPNTSGDYTFIITKYKRSSAADPWKVASTWSAKKDKKQIVVNEENIPYVKLIFPVANGLSWNGNAYNSEGGEQFCGADRDIPCDIYVMENVNLSYTLKEKEYEKALIINQNNNTDPIVKRDVRKEVYARGVGLIYKESTILNYCTTKCNGQIQFVNTGVAYKQTLTEYGFR